MPKHNKLYYEKDRNKPLTREIKYFKLSEFDCPCEKGSGKNMDLDFVRLLDEAREIAGVPFKINSGYRCKERNEKIGGVKSSSHTNIPCNAADISASDSVKRYKIINALIRCGARRIGIGKTFIHVDTDSKKSQDVMWHYYK